MRSQAHAPHIRGSPETNHTKKLQEFTKTKFCWIWHINIIWPYLRPKSPFWGPPRSTNRHWLILNSDNSYSISKISSQTKFGPFWPINKIWPKLGLSEPIWSLGGCPNEIKMTFNQEIQHFILILFQKGLLKPDLV